MIRSYCRRNGNTLGCILSENNFLGKGIVVNFYRRILEGRLQETGFGGRS